MKRTGATAQAAVVHQRGAPFSIETVDVEEPRGSEVLVCIRACGICHTDLDFAAGYGAVSFPAVFGHEGAGEVVAVGPRTNRVAVGDHVVLGFPWCGTCPDCRQARPANCSTLLTLFKGGTRRDGSTPFSLDGRPVAGFFGGQSSFSNLALVEERFVVQVAKSLDVEMLAPLGCGFSTGAGAVFKRLRPEPGTSIAVFGLGAVGLGALMAAKVVGCYPIVGVDLHESRRTVALDLGATFVFDPSAGSLVDRVCEGLDGGADYAVEAAGVPAVLGEAIAVLRQGGVCTFVGNHPEGSVLELPLGPMEWNRGLSGCNLGDVSPQDFVPRLIELHRAGLFPFERLITYYDLEQINQAVADAKSGRVIKPVLRFAPRSNREVGSTNSVAVMRDDRQVRKEGP